MTLIDEIDPASEMLATKPTPTPDEQQERPPSFYVRAVFGGIAGLAFLYLLATESKARSTLVTVVVAVAASAALWIGANILFNQVRDRWQRFNTLLYFSTTLIVTATLSGNRALGSEPGDDGAAKAVNQFVNGIKSGTFTSDSLVPGLVAWLWIPLLLSIGAGAVGFFLSTTDALPSRLAIGAGGLGLIGIVAGAMWNFNARPEVDAVGLIAWTAAFAGIGAGVAYLRNQDPIRSTLLGAAIGWVVGAFGAPEVGGGSSAWTVVAVAVPAAIIGVRAGIRPNLDLRGRAKVDTDSRKWIFLAPAVLFSFAMLVVPAIATIILSFRDRDGAAAPVNEEGGRSLLGNYRNIFQDENSWNPPDGLSLSIFGWSNGGSWLAVFIVVALAVVGLMIAKRLLDSTDLPSPGLVIGGVIAVLLLAAAINWASPNIIDGIIDFNLFRESTGRSALMLLGLIGLALFVVTGLVQRQRTGRVVELGSPSMGPLLVGGLLVLLAIVTTFRGTIVNNLWWVIVVTLFSTALGLAIAVLADGVKFEKVAKSIIFMPMAISLVGASVIWRFMYVARDSSKEQTGVLNSLWVALGRLSTGQAVASVAFVLLGLLIVVAAAVNFFGKRSGKGVAAGFATLIGGLVLLQAFAWVWGGQLSGEVQKWIVGLLVVAVVVALLILVAQRLTTRNYGSAVMPLVIAGLLGWFAARYFAVWGGGVGGQEINTVGNLKDSPINFVQESPFNSMFLMVVLIWIQTGFAMVILSAAIKAVPTELIEAAKVDGATDSQVFWRVTLPQVAPTIGVVVTTIVVLVMKVYDIVNVMTNGNFETDILANQMFTEAFSFRNQGQGAALAILIFVSVLPVMVFNIRRMQREN